LASDGVESASDGVESASDGVESPVMSTVMSPGAASVAASSASASSSGSDAGSHRSNVGGVERAKVTFDYEAEQDDNITISVGDVVVVSDKSDEGWWLGYVEGNPDKVGFFPATFVELLEDGGMDDSQGMGAAAPRALGAAAPLVFNLKKILKNKEEIKDHLDLQTEYYDGAIKKNILTHICKEEDTHFMQLSLN